MRITLGGETFAEREKCAKFCAFRVDKLSRMENVFY